MTVRALHFARLGGPEVLTLEEIELPEPGPGQVRVDVRAAGLNPYDAKVRTGVMGGEPEQPKPVGAELAGVVTAAGPDAPVAVGDRVLGMAAAGTGAMATAAIAGPVARIPDALSWVDAAAWPVAGETAIRCLRQLRVVAGEVLLVHGGAGTVGHLAVGLALRANVEVVATAAERDHDELRALGAIPVTYGAGWPDRVRAAVLGATGRGAPGEAPADRAGAGGAGVARVVDAVLDTAGTGLLAESVGLAGGPERVITIAGDDAQAAGVRFSAGASAEEKADAIARLPGLWEAGVRVPVASTYPLEQAREAYAALDARDPRGKLVVVTT